jgi:hypothetical protein
MFLELIAVIFAGFALAGITMLGNKLTGGRLPRWSVPVAAGLGMIAATISSEYSWYSRTAAALPEGVVVAETVENQSFWRPWTMAAPYVDRFAAVDQATVRRHPDQPGQRMIDIYFFGRWSPVQQYTALIDCPGNRRALLPTEASVGAEGTVAEALWSKAPENDGIMERSCEVG